MKAENKANSQTAILFFIIASRYKVVGSSHLFTVL